MHYLFGVVLSTRGSIFTINSNNWKYKHTTRVGGTYKLETNTDFTENRKQKDVISFNLRPEIIVACWDLDFQSILHYSIFRFSFFLFCAALPEPLTIGKLCVAISLFFFCLHPLCLQNNNNSFSFPSRFL